MGVLTIFKADFHHFKWDFVLIQEQKNGAAKGRNTVSIYLEDAHVGNNLDFPRILSSLTAAVQSVFFYTAYAKSSPSHNLNAP